MLIQNTIFYSEKWRWANFMKFLIYQLTKYQCLEYKISSDFSYKDSTYGSKKSKNNVNLFTWGVTHPERINFARAVCINSPNYSVLNFLIIPKTSYNVPFLGVDFVSLPKSHLLVLDFQPSIKVEKQFNSELLEQLLKLKKSSHLSLPVATSSPYRCFNYSEQTHSRHNTSFLGAHLYSRTSTTVPSTIANGLILQHISDDQ